MKMAPIVRASTCEEFQFSVQIGAWRHLIIVTASYGSQFLFWQFQRWEIGAQAQGLPDLNYLCSALPQKPEP